MPYKEREINKMYYTMGEVTEMFGVNASQIRFYEKEFDVLQPKKNKKGNRLFTPEDIENLKIPHPHIQKRRFILVPLSEILPQMQNPLLKKTNQELLDVVKDEGKVTKWQP